MFLGIFIVLTGVISLLETLNIIPTNIKWGMPLMFTCLGFSIIFNSIKTNRNEKNNK